MRSFSNPRTKRAAADLSCFATAQVQLVRSGAVPTHALHPILRRAREATDQIRIAARSPKAPAKPRKKKPSTAAKPAQKMMSVE